MILRNLLTISFLTSSALAASIRGADNRDLISLNSGNCAIADMLASSYYEIEVDLTTTQKDPTLCTVEDHLEIGDMIIEQFKYADMAIKDTAASDAEIASSDVASESKMCNDPTVGLGASHRALSEGDHRELFTYKWSYSGKSRCGFGCKSTNDRRRKLALETENEVKNLQNAEIKKKQEMINLAKVKRDNVKELVAEEAEQFKIDEQQEYADLALQMFDLWESYEAECLNSNTDSCKDKKDFLKDLRKTKEDGIKAMYEDYVDQLQDKIDSADYVFTQTEAELKKDIDDIKNGYKLTLEEIKAQKDAQTKLDKAVDKYITKTEQKIDDALKQHFSHCFLSDGDIKSTITMVKVDEEPKSTCELEMEA